MDRDFKRGQLISKTDDKKGGAVFKTTREGGKIKIAAATWERGISLC